MAVATYKYFVNIVPTKYIYLNGDEVTTFQYSVTEHESKVRALDPSIDTIERVTDAFASTVARPGPDQLPGRDLLVRVLADCGRVH